MFIIYLGLAVHTESITIAVLEYKLQRRIELDRQIEALA
jgi:hypothetical protein